MKPLKLRKGPEGTLTLKDLFFISLGQVVGTGVVTLVGVAMNQTGPSAWLAYPVAVFVGMILVYPYLMLGSTIRLGGGAYSAVSATMGPLASGVYCLSKLPSVVSMAAFPIAIGFYLSDVFPGTSGTVFAMVFLTVFYIVNMLGLKPFTKIQNIMGYVLLVGMFLLVVLGLFKIDPANLSVRQEGFFSHGAIGFFTAVFLMVGSTKGYYNSVCFGKNAKNARKDVPVSMVISALVILLMYTGVAVVDVGVLPLSEVAGKPLTVVAREVLPGALYYIFIFGGVIMALTTSVNASFGIFTREISTGIEDGWLPVSLAKKNRFGAPAYIVTFIFVAGAIPILTGFDVKKIMNVMLLFTGVVNTILFIGIFRLPTLYPEEWARKTVKSPTWLFYVIMVVATLIQFGTIAFSCRSLDALTIALSIGSMAVCAAYAFFRAKSGGYVIKESVWND